MSDGANEEKDMLQQLIDITKNCDALFKNYSKSSIDFIKNLDTSNVTSMNGMFNTCQFLTEIPFFDTGNVTNMGSMFNGGYNLKKVPLLNTSKVTNMYNMFNYCKVIEEIPLFDTSNVTNMGYMFCVCYALKTIPAFNVSNVTSMAQMFSYASNLKTILMYGMKVNFDISASTRFEREDLIVILNNLATVSTTQTLKMGTTNLNKLTDEDKMIAINKGWTLA